MKTADSSLSWEERCTAQNVEPTKISARDLKCMELGLPKGSSFLSIAKEIHGVKTLAEAEQVIGKDWVKKIC